MTDVEFAASVIGRRFVCDFQVLSFDRLGAVLLLYGDVYRISVEELRTIIERGLVTEIPVVNAATRK